jgi:hypothetical protein
MAAHRLQGVALPLATPWMGDLTSVHRPVAHVLGHVVAHAHAVAIAHPHAVMPR